LPKGATDLKNIYNNDVIQDNGGKTNNSRGDDPDPTPTPDPTPSLLSTPSFAFPFFGPAPDARSMGPNEKFAAFVNKFDNENQFLVNQSGGAEKSKLGLININTQDATHY
jgi:hypothetical protein